jgi:hypothetical protein
MQIAPDLFAPDPNSLAYLIATLSEGAISFYWVYSEGLWNRSQIQSSFQLVLDEAEQLKQKVEELPPPIAKVEEPQRLPDEQDIEERIDKKFM